MFSSILRGSVKLESIGLNTTASTGTVLTANATVGSDGAWTQLVAATADDIHAITVLLQPAGTVSANELIDIAIGASGLEQVLVSDLLFQQLSADSRGGTQRTWLPLHIPKGSRVSARVHRASAASAQCAVFLLGETHPASGWPSFHRATTYGIDLANQRGTSVDSGATANTQGARTDIVTSTGNPFGALYVMCTRRNSGVVTSGNKSTLQLFLTDGVSEWALTSEFPTWAIDSVTDIAIPVVASLGPLLCNLPTGSRIAAKARSASVTAGVRESQVALIGLD